MAEEHREQDYDAAIAGRLARLRHMPVDTTRLDVRLARSIPRPARQLSGRRQWLRPLRVAAAALIAFSLGAVVLFSLAGRPVLASPEQLAEIHQKVVFGHEHSDGQVHRITSMQEADQVLSSQWKRMPDLPNLPEAHVMTCCLHSVGRKRVGAVGLMAGDVPVTLAIANAGDARFPESAPIRVGENRYWVQASQNVNMVLTQRDGTWMCLMGETSVERLIELAEGLQF